MVRIAFLHLIIFLCAFSYSQINDSSMAFQDETVEIKKSDTLSIHAQALQEKAQKLTSAGKFNEAITTFSEAINLFKEINDQEQLVNSFYQRGKAYRNNGNYDNSLKDILESLRIAEEINDYEGIAFAYLNIGILYSIRPEMSEETGIPYFQKALETGRKIKNYTIISYALNNLALVYIDQEEYDLALDFHLQSLSLKQKFGSKKDVATSLENIADIYFKKGDYNTSIRYNNQALNIYREIDNKLGIAHTLLDMARCYEFLEQPDNASGIYKEAIILAEQIESYQLRSGAYDYLAQYYESKNDFRQALYYFKKYKEAEDSLYSENSSRMIAEMKTRYETEKKEADIKRLEDEKTIQDLKLQETEDERLYLLLAAIFTFLLAGFAIYGFRQKQKANKYLEERNRFEIENKKKAINLFGQQVSKEVALELLSDSFKSGSKRLFACIMFLDIRNFTPFVAKMEPDEIIQYQNDVFGFMIDVISKHHGIVNQFMGDGFMATFGAPVSSGNDCQNAVNASIEIIEILNTKLAQGKLPLTKIGIGLHAGNIVTGNVGTTERKQYSITGNTVILASRIEQLNKKYKSEILISREVLEKLDNSKLKTENLGSVKLKGRKEPIEIVRLLMV